MAAGSESPYKIYGERGQCSTKPAVVCDQDNRWKTYSAPKHESKTFNFGNFLAVVVDTNIKCVDKGISQHLLCFPYIK